MARIRRRNSSALSLEGKLLASRKKDLRNFSIMFNIRVSRLDFDFVLNRIVIFLIAMGIGCLINRKAVRWFCYDHLTAFVCSSLFQNINAKYQYINEFSDFANLHILSYEETVPTLFLYHIFLQVLSAHLKKE
jgi:hypothetical protein